MLVDGKRVRFADNEFGRSVQPWVEPDKEVAWLILCAFNRVVDCGENATFVAENVRGFRPHFKSLSLGPCTSCSLSATASILVEKHWLLR